MAKKSPMPQRYRAGDAASKYSAKLGLSGVVDVKDVERATADYESACIGASREGMNKAGQLLLLKAREYAPKSSVHRVTRTYPGGRKYDEPLHLWQAMTKRVGKVSHKTHRLYAKVSNRYGYINMVIGAAKKRGVQSFLIRAREAVFPQVVEILKREWPKNTRQAKAPARRAA